MTRSSSISVDLCVDFLICIGKTTHIMLKLLLDYQLTKQQKHHLKSLNLDQVEFYLKTFFAYFLKNRRSKFKFINPNNYNIQNLCLNLFKIIAYSFF